jgi:CHAT domain-containing protein
MMQPYLVFTSLKETEKDLAAAILHYKGVVLDSIIEDRLLADLGKDNNDLDLVAQLTSDKREVGQLLLQPSDKPPDETNRKIVELEQEIEQIEGQLAKHVAGLGRARQALGVTLDQVQEVIPKDGVLIEYIRYSHYLGTGKFEQRYGAIVLTSSGQPKWIPLRNAETEEVTVNRYQSVVRGAPDEEELSGVLEQLYSDLWSPIEQSLPSNTKRVIISPDSQLSFISFATLLDSEGHFLAEKYRVQYVASGRDLLRDFQPTAVRTAAIFANPNFTLTPGEDTTGSGGQYLNHSEGSIRGNEKADIKDLHFEPLAGTQTECDKLASVLESWQWKVNSFTGDEATKEALSRIHSPYILHLATHGFFAREDQSAIKTIEQRAIGFESSLASSRFFSSPMHRSGLALAGAQTTLRAWKRGEAPLVTNDGILTAEDVAALDLKGTWLVTLSACDTASGEAKAGEGVMGLRRGFMEAGTQNLLMTLWPISDQTTVQIMLDFYEAAHRTGDAPQALAEVQRDWLVRLRKRDGLAKAVVLSGAFIMSSQGKPKEAVRDSVDSEASQTQEY